MNLLRDNVYPRVLHMLHITDMLHTATARTDKYRHYHRV